MSYHIHTLSMPDKYPKVWLLYSKFMLINFSCFCISNYSMNKTVLLRDRKRHTARAPPGNFCQFFLSDYFFCQNCFGGVQGGGGMEGGYGGGAWRGAWRGGQGGGAGSGDQEGVREVGWWGEGGGGLV